MDQAARAFRALLRDGQPVDRAGLAEVSSIGSGAVRELLDALDGDAALPLCHRGLLVGCVILGAAHAPLSAAEKRVRLAALAAHTTVAVVGALLDIEVGFRGRPSRRLSQALSDAFAPGEKADASLGFVLGGASRQVPDCGGDFWMAETLGKDRLLIVLGDAAGHGASAAMLVTAARGAVLAARESAGLDTTPEGVLQAMHRAVSRSAATVPGGPRMSALACVLDASSREVAIGAAAHEPPHVLIRGQAPTVEPLELAGPPLGSPGDPSFPVSRRALRPGECLLFASDGLIEAGAPSAVPFGRRRFASLVLALASRTAAALPDSIFDEVERYLAGRPVADDMTVIAVEPRTAEVSA
jgi:serine phosphatase RsbU (regulator of sigma subunit)